MCVCVYVCACVCAGTYVCVCACVAIYFRPRDTVVPVNVYVIWILAK